MNKLKIMKSINKFLYEFYPSHPDDIVIKNDYYPRGIKEVNIYNYYLSIKDKLINWIDGKRVAFLLRLSPKQTVLIRNQKGKPIHLTSHNFEDIITGRTNVIYVTEDGLVNNWVIDIDAGENINIIHVQKVLDILQHELIPNNIDSLGIKKTEAILTSPQGIHLIGYLNHATNIDILRNQLSNELQRVSNLINPKSKIKNNW